MGFASHVSEAFPALFPLRSLLPEAGGDGRAGFVLYGTDAQDHSGKAVSSAGDINGDGIDDLVTVSTNISTSYVIFGRRTADVGLFPPASEVSSLLPANGGDGSAGFVVYGDHNALGLSVSEAGDVNGDGIGDLILGGPNSRPGLAVVLFGRNSAQGDIFSAEIESTDLWSANGGDGSRGFILYTTNDAGNVGCSVSGAGDVNGDGVADIIIGNFIADAGSPARDRAGATYVVFGRHTNTLGNFPAEFDLRDLLASRGGDGSEGFVLNGIDPVDYSGGSVSVAGDVNGDGIDDIIIGAESADQGDRSTTGESYVVFGRDTALVGNFPAELELSALLAANGGDGSEGFVLNGIADGDRSGWSVSGAGDVNGDGIDDVIIGAPRADPGGRLAAGQSYVLFGRDTLRTGNFPPTFPLARLLPIAGGDGSLGFVVNGIQGGSSDADQSGYSVNGAGDINGDGIDDLLIGAPEANVGARSNAGQSYVVFGRDTAQVGNFPATLPLAGLAPAGGGDGSTGFILGGIDAYDESGCCVSAAGDLDGDGIGDLVIGAWLAEPVPRGRLSAGESYVVFGRP